MIKSISARKSETNVTTKKTEKKAFFTCGFVGNITFANSSLEFLKAVANLFIIVLK